MSADSILVEPPTPHPIHESPSSSQKPSFFRKLKSKQSPPTAYSTQFERRAHKRSSSFGEIVARILPSNREERGHTLRRRYVPNSNQDPVELVFGTAASKTENLTEGSAIEVGAGSRDSQASRKAHCHGTEIHVRADGLIGATYVDGSDGNNDTHGRAMKISPTGRDRPHSMSWGRRLGLRRNGLDEGYLFQQPDDKPIYGPSLSPEKDGPDSKTQKMFDDKKIRRQQRRSLRDSGDFLGVQGANPRTGYYDISSGTSSSEPSQMSEETKKKLDDEAKNVEEQRKQYEVAKAMHETELVRVQSLRDEKKAEKERRKKLELKMKQRRRGKWKLSEEGWHSIAEPDLSPIIQSVAGSPGKETAPDDRLFPMPTADDPTPYVNPNNIGPQDYFGHRMVSSPLTKERLSAQSGSPSSPSPRSSTSIPRKPVGSSARGSIDNVIRSSPPVLRKPVGSPVRPKIDGYSLSSSPTSRKTIETPPRRKTDGSSDIIIHTASTENSTKDEHHTENPLDVNIHESSPAQSSLRNVLQIGPFTKPSPGLTPHITIVDLTSDTDLVGRQFLGSMSASQKFDAFLDRNLDLLVPEDPSRNEATATLFRSASTNQAEILLQLDQSLKATSPATKFNTVADSPPVFSRDPFAARIPVNSRPMVSTVWAPPTILSSPRRQTPRIITIPTTTTTGSAQLLPLHAQFDDQNDMSDPEARRPSLQRKSSRIPLRTSCLPSSEQPTWQNTESQADPVDIAISSEHLLATTKQRTAESCHTMSPEGRKTTVKTTPIFMSTSQPTHEMVSPAARIAFLTPFQNLRHRAAMVKAEAQSREACLTPPTKWAPIVKVGNVNLKAKVPQGDPGGTEGPFKTKLGDYDAYRSGMNGENVTPVKKVDWEDSLIVSHPSPSAEIRKASQASPASGSVTRSSASSPQRQLTSDEKYGIVRCENGSSAIMVGHSPRHSTSGSKAMPKAEDTRLVKHEAKKGGSTNKRAPPKTATPRTQKIDISAISLRVFLSVWCFVEPVFDPKSALRKKCDAGQRLTLQDILQFMVAAGCLGAALLLIILSFRVLITGLQTVTGFWNVFRVMTGL